MQFLSILQTIAMRLTGRVALPTAQQGLLAYRSGDPSPSAVVSWYGSDSWSQIMTAINTPRNVYQVITDTTILVPEGVENISTSLQVDGSLVVNGRVTIVE